MKMKKARRTAAILAVMALTAGFSVSAADIQSIVVYDNEMGKDTVTITGDQVVSALDGKNIYANDIWATGDIYADTITTNNGAVLNGGVDVNGGANINGAVSIETEQSRASVNNDNIIFESNGSNVSIAKDGVTFNSGAVAVTGDTVIAGTVQTDTITAQTGETVTIDAKDTYLTGNTTVQDSLTVNNGTTLNGGATVNGGATINGTTEVNGDTYVNGGVTSDTLTVNSGSTLNGGTTLNGGATVNGDFSAASENGNSHVYVNDSNIILESNGSNISVANGGVAFNSGAVSIVGDTVNAGTVSSSEIHTDLITAQNGETVTIDGTTVVTGGLTSDTLTVNSGAVINGGATIYGDLNANGGTIGDVTLEDGLVNGIDVSDLNTTVGGFADAGIVAGTIKDGVSNGMAIGHSYVGANQGIAIGDDATINDDSVGSIAFGVGAHVYASNAVALGFNSIANRENTVSVGSQGNERQITNVAAGTERTDAVNKGQLDDALAGVGIDSNGGNVIQADKDGNVTIDGNLDVNGGLTVGDTVISGEDLAGVADISGIKTDVATNTSNITALQSKVGSGDITVKDEKGNPVTNLTDAVNANYTQIQNNSNAISSLGSRVSDLGDEIDNVGAISAALAGLHPLDYDGTGSKFQLSAAMGTYDGSQAAAIGAFYHFNRDVMISLGGATAFDGDHKTAGNLGVTFRVGAGASGKAVSDDVMARLEAMDRKITALEQENKDLKNVLGAIDTSLSKEFPDVPANHWAYEAVTKLAGNDVVAGYPDGEFHGDRTMTRYEMAEVIYKAMQKGAKVDQKLVNEFKPEMEQVAANQNA